MRLRRHVAVGENCQQDDTQPVGDIQFVVNRACDQFLHLCIFLKCKNDLSQVIDPIVRKSFVLEPFLNDFHRYC